jgi:hypothetical protein
MSRFPRPRHACRGDRPERPADVPQGQNPRLQLNRLFLSGILAADPRRDEARDGRPVTLLLVAFPAPDSSDTAEAPETASCEVEVPEHVDLGRPEELRAGASIFVTAQLNGGGGVLATEVHSGPPPESASR